MKKIKKLFTGDKGNRKEKEDPITYVRERLSDHGRVSYLGTGEENKPIVGFDTKGRPMVVLMCNDYKFLDGMKRAMSDLIQENHLDLDIVYTYLSANVIYDFSGVKMMLLVAKSQQDNISLSKKDLTPHSKIYYQASKDVSVFLALVGHKKSQHKNEKEAYSSSLNRSIRNQKELDKLTKLNHFISLGYTHEPKKLQFDDKQKYLIETWLQQYLSESSNKQFVEDDSPLCEGASSHTSLSGSAPLNTGTQVKSSDYRNSKKKYCDMDNQQQVAGHPYCKISSTERHSSPRDFVGTETESLTFDRPQKGLTETPMDITQSVSGNVPESVTGTATYRNLTEFGVNQPSRHQATHRHSVMVVACQNYKFLEKIANELIRLVEQKQFMFNQPIKVVAHLISTRQDPAQALNEADLLLLVGMSTQRLMLISDKEPGPLDTIYREAKKGGVRTFFVLVGHVRSQYLKSFELYDETELHSVFKSQPAIKEFNDKNRFISVGYSTCPENLRFNERQIEHILYWIMETVNPTEARLPEFKTKMHLKETLDYSGTSHRNRHTLSNLQMRKNEPQEMDELDFRKYHHPYESSASNMNPINMITQQTPIGQEPKRTTNLAIACGNSRFLQSVSEEINRILTPNKELFCKEINIHPFQISARVNPVKALRNTSMLVLVATSNQRLMLLSDREPGPLNDIHREAKRREVSIFFVLVGHLLSNNLQPSQPFSLGLESLFKSQPAVGEFKESNRFISVGFATNPASLNLNETQARLILTWIKESTECESRMVGSSTTSKRKMEDDESDDEDIDDYETPVKRNKIEAIKNVFSKFKIG